MPSCPFSSFSYPRPPSSSRPLRSMIQLDQGALGMSDPCGTLPLALKPNAVPRINCLLSNFYFCANWSVVPCQMIGLEGPVWGGGYMPRRRRLYANCQLPVELILYELRPNSPGGGYMPTTIRRRLYANWYSTNSDLTVPAEVICHFPLQLAYELRPKWSRRRLYAKNNTAEVICQDQDIKCRF